MEGKQQPARMSRKLPGPPKERQPHQNIPGSDKKEHSQNRKATEKSPVRILLWRMAKPVLSVLIGLVIVIIGLNLLFQYGYNEYFAPVDAADDEKIEVTIERGSSLTTISELLEEKGIVRSATVFKYYVDFSDMSSKLKAGTYELSPNMTFDDIIDVLKRANEMSDVERVTFVEGLTVEETAQKPIEYGIPIDADRFVELAKTGEAFAEDYDFIAAVIEENEKSEDKRRYILEGYLAPDSYDFYTTASEEQVIERLLQQFDKIFTEEYRERAEELGMTIDEVVTLASIIEREGKKDDFAKVSAVFHNRLKEGMKLESCATIQYFMNERRLRWTDAEKKIDSPYNTYLYEGLPIGPICSPGKDAIEAALYPDEEYLKEGYLFFCLGDPKTGELYFAKTNAEHEENVAKYEALWEEYDKELKE